MWEEETCWFEQKLSASRERLFSMETVSVKCNSHFGETSTTRIIFFSDTDHFYKKRYSLCNTIQNELYHHHHHHHHISFMELGHLLTRSGLTYPEVSSKVYYDSFCKLGSSISLPWVIYFEAFYLHVVSTFSCIPVICPEFVLF